MKKIILILIVIAVIVVFFFPKSMLTHNSAITGGEIKYLKCFGVYRDKPTSNNNLHRASIPLCYGMPHEQK